MNELISLLPDSTRQSYLSVFPSTQNQRGALLLQVLADLLYKQWYQELTVKEAKVDETNLPFIVATTLNKQAKAEARKKDKKQTSTQKKAVDNASEVEKKDQQQGSSAIIVPLPSHQTMSLFKLDQLLKIVQQTMKELQEGDFSGHVMLCILDSDSTAVYYQLSKWT
eukprot:TRINITY_DN3232_c0_g1_i1.p1 TRINITY_DN3232_c0_g1~~TRINITY_DN3232_c0_g1_i1.p1  ORF type:complete len:167 (-),score=10.45 TRINITY_DN3232_c0_g1_i1:32-532(-)